MHVWSLMELNRLFKKIIKPLSYYAVTVKLRDAENVPFCFYKIT